MTVMTKRGQQDNVITYEHICDTIEDMGNIAEKYITMGSVCIVINGSAGGLEVYIANSSGEWILINGASVLPNESEPQIIDDDQEIP